MPADHSDEYKGRGSHPNSKANMKPRVARPFWSLVDKSGQCWVWMAGKSAKGYGLYRHDKLAHRISWEETFGSIPVGLCVLHHCDNPACVRPSHLFIGTKTDNNADRDRKGRHIPLRGERNGSAKISDNEVEEIRRSPGSQRQIAKQFGISQAQVWNILNRRQRCAC